MTTNFSKEEFDCADGSAMPLEVLNNVIDVAKQLEIVRAHFNAPITVNSAYRNPVYNRQVGGAVNSQHLSGKAADIVVSGISPDDVADAIEFLMDEGLILSGGIGRYNTFTHYDIRGKKVTWDFRT